jgi:hypothetical protein
VIDRPCVTSLAQNQAGIVSRRQLLDLGLSPAQARACVDTRRWRRLGTGVYATFTGPISPLASLWIALLRAGPGAVAGPQTSLWLMGLLDELPSTIDIDIPQARRVRTGATDGVAVRRCSSLEQARHPIASPPRLRVEPAVVDATSLASRPEQVIDVVLRAIQRRMTTPSRLAMEIGRRRAHRWRGLLVDLLADTESGVASALELRWRRHVERPHGLPRGRYNHADLEMDGGRRYRDVAYPYSLVIELDGREAHPDEARFRDRRRDNRVVVSGRTTLRYGWREVVADPCGVAAETAEVLTRLGWSGTLSACGPDCSITTSS